MYLLPIIYYRRYPVCGGMWEVLWGDTRHDVLGPCHNSVQVTGKHGNVHVNHYRCIQLYMCKCWNMKYYSTENLARLWEPPCREYFSVSQTSLKSVSMLHVCNICTRYMTSILRGITLHELRITVSETFFYPIQLKS